MDDNYEYNEEDYENNDYMNDDIIDEGGQNDVLETMFLTTKNSNEDDESKIKSYLEAISLDENKEKIISYKCYEEICLICLENENHFLFSEYYRYLQNICKTLKENIISDYIKNTSRKFITEILTQKSISITHWLEDMTSNFDIKEKDKIKNMFEASIYLFFTKQVNNNNKKEDDLENNTDSTDQDKFISFKNMNLIEYSKKKQQLSFLTMKYLIDECKCDSKYLDSKGNSSFLFKSQNLIRGGEPYTPPFGWIAFGLEVINKYSSGNEDWLANDGRVGEWAVAYHGFGSRVSGQQLKDLIKVIVHDNLRPGAGQAYLGASDRRHPGKTCGKGVYVTPNLEIAQSYAGRLTLANKQYYIVVMVRVKTDMIREPTSMKDYWILDGNADQLRPYRLLIKDINLNDKKYN